MPYKDPDKRKAAKAASEKKAKEESQLAEEIRSTLEAVAAGEVEVTPELAQAIAALPAKYRPEAENRIAEHCKGQSGAHWAAVIYPESLPPDWEDKLRLSGHIVAVSPLHDKDLDKHGQLKKPHYHMILTKRNGGKYTYRTAAAVTQGMLHGTIPIRLESPRGYYRYLCHLDNPDKARYREEDIIRINGFDPEDFCDLTAAEVDELRVEITKLIRTEDIDNYADLVDKIQEAGSKAALRVVCTQTLFFREYIYGHRKRREAQRAKEAAPSPEAVLRAGAMVAASTARKATVQAMQAIGLKVNPKTGEVTAEAKAVKGPAGPAEGGDSP